MAIVPGKKVICLFSRGACSDENGHFGVTSCNGQSGFCRVARDPSDARDYPGRPPDQLFVVSDNIHHLPAKHMT